MFRTRIGIRALLGLVGLCALVFWAMKVSRDSRPAHLYSKWLIDGDDSRRVQAAQELGSLDAESEVAAPVLLRALKTDRSAPVRKRSIVSLVDVVNKLRDGPTTEAAAASLVEALGDEDADVRRAAADALGRIGPEPKAIMPALLRASADGSEWVRGAAVFAIGVIERKAKIDEPEARGAIIQAMIDPSLHVREAGLYAFWAVADNSTAFSVALLKDDDPRARLAAMAALARESRLASRIVLELTEALADPDPAIRAGAAKVLGNVRPLPGPAVIALGQALGDPDEAVREAAARALANGP